MTKKTDNLRKSELIKNNKKVLEEVMENVEEINKEVWEIHKKISLLL